MTTPVSTLSVEPLRDCLREWEAEQQGAAAELAESLAAVEAFERQLEGWRERLAAERDELEQERETLRSEREELQAQLDKASQQGGGASNKQLAKLESEIEALQSALTRTTSDRDEANVRAGDIGKQLHEALQREGELAMLLENQRYELASLRSKPENEVDDEESTVNMQVVPVKPAAAGPSDPVLDTVLAQFGKLRRQRADRRPGG